MAGKVAVIGMGNVGAAVAHQLVVEGCTDELLLYDKNEKKVKADALDFEDAMNNLPFHVNITVNDYERLKDADVIVSALGDIHLITLEKADRFAELRVNKSAVAEVGKKIKDSGFKGILVDITNPCDAICGLYQKATNLPRENIMGTGTLLDSARLHRAVGKFFNVNPKSVQGYSLGEHGDSQFVAWSTVKVLDLPVEKLAAKSGIDLEAVEKETRSGGFTVFAGKLYTNYGVAASAVRLVRAIMSDSHEVFPVSNYRDEYGTYLSYPAVVGRKGIVKQVQLDLREDELEKLKISAETILEKESFNE